MTNYKSIFKYAVALVVGYLLGMQLQQFFNHPNSPIVRNNQGPMNSSLTESNSDAAQTQGNALPSSVKYAKDLSLIEVHQTETGDQNENKRWSANELIDYLASLNKESFQRHFTDRKVEKLFKESPDLVFELLARLIELEDSTTKNFLSGLLYSTYRINDRTNGTPYGDAAVEKWVMEKVILGERGDEWLAVLAKWGVNSDDSIAYLGSSLASLSDPESITTTINALAMNKSYIWNKNDLHAQTTQLIAPYLTAADDRVRAAAVQSLGAFPGNDVTQKLEVALTDAALEVRLNAIIMVGNGNARSPNLKRLLLKSMTNKDASAAERIAAFDILPAFLLTGEDYQSVYEFSQGEATELRQQSIREIEGQRK